MGAGVQVGDVLAEKYEVTRILGMGGMGVVAAAHHRELDRRVALKFMHEEVADEQVIDRFLCEARAAARLQSEHVGHVLDVGRRADGVPYLVMEYLEGRDLAQISAQRGPLDVAEVVEYILQACEAMAEAHARGIVHRDLKPRNLFVAMRPDGRPLVKVLDVGISKERLVPVPDVIHAALGSPAYMAPEHVRSARAVDPRADIWSLGVILYQLLVGALPFAGATITDVIFRVMIDPAPPLAAARPDLPPGLVAVIERCLEKDRAKRFDSVAALAYELMPFAPRAPCPSPPLRGVLTRSGIAGYPLGHA
jgi:serine/threonine-protein kinase